MLKDLLKKNEITAMKAREKAKVSVLRLVSADIKAYEVNERKEITDELIVKIIEKNIKQTREALEYAKQLNDEVKISEGNFAIEVLTEYLPEQLSEEVVLNMIKEIVANGNYKMSDMGKIMKEIIPKVNGKFDRSKINPMVKSLFI
ncbi:MAG: GatB/YqeY domain-containing protein [Clostridiaceae bacterium]